MSATTETSGHVPVQTAASVSSFRMIATMASIGFACAMLIVVTFQLTLSRITANKIAALEKAVFEVVPGADKKVTFELNGGKLVPLTAEETTAPKYYACYNTQDRLVGV
ncbi:MAG: hypothetical protein P8181_17265, partial [bacterium]